MTRHRKKKASPPTPQCAVCGEKFTPAIAMLNLGTSLALAGLAATLVTVDDTAVERADYWARRAGIDITTAEKTTS